MSAQNSIIVFDSFVPGAKPIRARTHGFMSDGQAFVILTYHSVQEAKETIKHLENLIKEAENTKISIVKGYNQVDK